MAVGRERGNVRSPLHAPAVRLRLRSQAGQALPMVLGIMVVFGISVGTVVWMSSGASRDANRENAHDTALSVAEGGAANGLAVLAQSPRPLSTTSMPTQASPQTDTIDGKTVSWYGSLAGDTWTITATSSVPNPAGGGMLHRTVQIDAEVGSTTINQAWNYVYAASTGCLNLDNSTIVTEPLYTRGDLCLNNSAKVLGSPV